MHLKSPVDIPVKWRSCSNPLYVKEVVADTCVLSRDVVPLLKAGFKAQHTVTSHSSTAGSLSAIMAQDVVAELCAAMLQGLQCAVWQ
jgi:hypothetical protein